MKSFNRSRYFGDKAFYRLLMTIAVPVMLQKLELKDNARRALDVICAMIAGVGETTARSLRDFFILHPPHFFQNHNTVCKKSQ